MVSSPTLHGRVRRLAVPPLMALFYVPGGSRVGQAHARREPGTQKRACEEVYFSRKGMPIALRKARPSSSVLAVVQIVMSIPRCLSNLS